MFQVRRIRHRIGKRRNSEMPAHLSFCHAFALCRRRREDRSGRLTWRFPLALVVVAMLSDAACPAFADDHHWSSYGGAPGGGQYSPLSQIDRNNVSTLEMAWVHHSGDVAEPDSPTGPTSLEVTPIFANDLLYVCTPLNRVLALNPETGEEIWAFDPYAELLDEDPVSLHCRGVAYWEASAPALDAVCTKRIYKTDYSGRIFALDGDTGDICADFGGRGYIRLNDYDYRGAGRVGLTSPPVIYKNSLIVGAGVIDNLQAETPDGIVRAFDARSGEELWNFNPIPEELSDKTGAANVWTPFSVDAEASLVFLPTSSPSVDPYGGHRTAPIPYANALVVLNAETGEVVWHYQIVHHDLFDYDLPAQPILVDVPKDGALVPAVIQITKMGYAFVFQRYTGEPLFPLSEVSVPQTDVPGEVSSATQPVPALPEPFARQNLAPADVWGLTVFDRAWCRNKMAGLRYDGMYTPPSLTGSLIFPSALGGGNWGGAAFDPERHLLIVKAQNIATIMKLVPAEDDREGRSAPTDFLNQPMYGTPYRLEGEFFVSPLGVPCISPPWGELTALDLKTGKIRWRVPLGSVSIGPFSTPTTWGSPNVGGPMSTGGGVTFIAATFDSRFRAFDSETGEELWAAQLPAPGMAVPMTFEAGPLGRQYVVIAAGGNAIAGTKLGDALIAYALPPDLADE